MCGDRLVAVATYGTLKKGGRLCHPKYIICSSKDHVKGKLFKVNGGTFPFPCIHLEGEDLVEVEVQIISQMYYDYMVMVEGSMFSTKEVITEAGVPVLIFEFKGEVGKRIESGIWEN